MNNLHKELEDIIARCDYSNNGIDPISYPVTAIMDAVISSLPSPEDNSPNSHEGAYIEGRNHTLREIRQLLESAKKGS